MARVWLSLQRQEIGIMSFWHSHKVFWKQQAKSLWLKKVTRIPATCMLWPQHEKGKIPLGFFVTIREYGAPILMRWML